MIDWVTAIIPCHHDEMIFGGFVTSVSLDGEIDWRVEKKQKIVGSHESNLSIKSLDNKHLLIDGNPAKWLQGHNIFGSDNLIGLVEARGHKLPDEIELRDNLIEYADNKLRGELTLRSIQLKEKNLSVAQQWIESTPIEQLIKYIESLNMSEQFSTPR